MGSGMSHEKDMDRLVLLTVEDPEVRKTKLAAEIANGRLAMVALMAMFPGFADIALAYLALWRR